MMTMNGTNFLRLRQIVEEMTPHGATLKALGPFAPPCLAVPYAHMRAMVQYTFERVWAEFVAGDTELQRKVDTAALAPLIVAVKNLPEVTEMWRDAPPQWRVSPLRPTVYISPDADLHIIIPTGYIPTGAGGLSGEPSATNIGSGNWLKGFRARILAASTQVYENEDAIFGRSIHPSDEFSISDLGSGIATGAFLGWWLGGPVGAIAGGLAGGVLAAAYDILAAKLIGSAAPSLFDTMKLLVDSFEQEYRPATIQQRRALDRAIKAAGGDPALFIGAMTTINPALENTLPAGEGSGTGEFSYAAGMQINAHSLWPFLGLLFTGIGAGVALGD